ncbi:hypothetical protein N7528_002867 [Penicillium herquei]|nr:hypothetical protein N7528_002867 [Penicillium herquei]
MAQAALPHASTGVSPFKAERGYNMRLDLDYQHDREVPDEPTTGSIMSFVDRMTEIWEKVLSSASFADVSDELDDQESEVNRKSNS